MRTAAAAQLNGDARQDPHIQPLCYAKQNAESRFCSTLCTYHEARTMWVPTQLRPTVTRKRLISR
jgi:hypothetical protein